MRFLLLILLLVIVACTKEIDIDQPFYQSKIVVDGWIESGDYAYVILTRSSPFLTEYDSASIRNTFLNYAKVTLNSSKGESEILILSRKDEFFPPFVYRSRRIKGEPNVSYSLKIEVSGAVVESQTVIPDLPTVFNVIPVSTSDTTMQLEATVQDDSQQTNYYFTQIKTKNYDTNFHPSSFPIFNDKGKNGEDIKLKIYHSRQPDPLNMNDNDLRRNLPLFHFHISDTVFLKVSSISEASFSVLNDIYLDQQNSSNPFAFINKETNTNIIGGIGRWTGLASANFVVYK